ncbi:unnamed protein product [Rotaria magnacalcarata]|uniref:Uncharacterized protein n=1 Tax=Rotaria magnacalcarata TaxID=392030 RepID=A0A817ABE4_9BILA|nr:unnamed protein product [Rotaria magnacalcarata]CAF1464372.1 unnamed protein product [Rotaria magnacalcarata]CAF1985998.1 unnamed protein product [Rotaria magnacalcarata]CAF2128298.1 unnamed protein product [Rotaria magnacalcarata]CAF2249382.1 unnamed protein product [Rotaria magnacalcarata]
MVFISDNIGYTKYRNELLHLPLKAEEILSNSPRANKDSVQSVLPTLDIKLNFNESITFLYIDTEFKEYPFRDNKPIEWYDCQTSSQLISTLVRMEQSCFIVNPNHLFILIIDSSTQVSVNDYFNTTSRTHVMSIEENTLLTVQRHTILYRLIMKYKLSCILIEHLDVNIPMFDTVIGKRDEKSTKQMSRTKDVQSQLSEFAFRRLTNSEHYRNDWNNQLDYRQITGSDMMKFLNEPKRSPLFSLSLLNNEELNDQDENIS